MKSLEKKGGQRDEYHWLWQTVDAKFDKISVFLTGKGGIEMIGVVFFSRSRSAG